MSSAKTKLVKDCIEDDGDDEDDVPIAISSRKKSALGGSTQKSNAKRMEKEQPEELGNEEEEVKDEEDEEEKNKSKKKKKTVNKKEGINEKEKEREPTVKKRVQNKKGVWKNDKRVSEDHESTEIGEVKKAKERKVYALPGQKHDTPEERDALRIFYETLYQQVPTSEMAKIWMMEWGLLPSEEAAIVYEMKLKKRLIKSPFKSVSKITDEVSIVKSKKEITVKTETKMVKKRKTGFEGSDEDIAPRKKIKRGK